jgi:large subunit ribosomal protein L3
MLGKKVGMTRVFDERGRQVPVTVVEAGPCVVLQLKTKDVDGYNAAQLGFVDRAEGRTSQPDLGRFRKAGTTPRRYVREFRLDAGDTCRPGDAVTVALFEKVPYVDVTGVTKGRGFQGVVKRHRMSGGPMTHGGHSKRRPGSIGNRTTPGWVHKGKRMPGQMGNTRVTVQNLRVVQVRPEDNLLLIEGSLPGAVGGLVMVKKCLKRPGPTS